MRGHIRSGGAGIPLTETASGEPAGVVVAEVISMPAGPYVVEQGRFTLERCLSAATHNLGANGAIGDYLSHVYFPRAPQGTKAGLIYIRDGGTIVTQFEFDPITEGIRAGMSIPINAVSQLGTWAIQIVDNNSVSEVVAVGRFTD